jgi:hypothetical protein
MGAVATGAAMGRYLTTVKSATWLKPPGMPMIVGLFWLCMRSLLTRIRCSSGTVIFRHTTTGRWKLEPGFGQSLPVWFGNPLAGIWGTFLRFIETGFST